MSRFSALPPGVESPSSYSRRRFLRQLIGAGALTFGGVDSLLAQSTSTTTTAEAFRFAFLTDLHLLQGGALRSVEGITACLDAVQKLDPRPDFILCGGDLVHSTRELTLPGAETALDFFLKIWNDHTDLPTRWTFGNHDLACTSNVYVDIYNPLYAKGLFKDRLKMQNLFYSFDVKGWHFVVLDDISLQTDRTKYIGELFDYELAFLKADLDAHRNTPTIVCSHIPIESGVVLPFILAHDLKANPKTLVCSNGDAMLADIPGHNIRAVLSGHLHFHEELSHHWVPIINSGAVCGSYWKGPNNGCPEGFGVVDLGADGSVKFDYRNYGWKA